MDFPMNLWLFWMCVINVLFKVITNHKFCKHCFIKEHLQKHICFIGWFHVRMFLCLPPPLPQEIHRLCPMDLKIYSLERTPRLWLPSSVTIVTWIQIQTSCWILIQSQCYLKRIVGEKMLAGKNKVLLLILNEISNFSPFWGGHFSLPGAGSGLKIRIRIHGSDLIRIKSHQIGIRNTGF